MRFVLLALCSCSVVPTLAAPPELVAKADVRIIDGGVAQVGIDKAKGGSITWLSWKGYDKNVVNIHDPGRLIQQSYYTGRSLDRQKDGQHEAWSPWPWNPIQGGGVGSWARITRFEEKKDAELFAETIPKLWDMDDEEAEAVMQQWTAFEPGMPEVVVVKNRLECRRTEGDRWGPASARHQELPACYFTRNFDRFEVYLGEGKWRTVTQKPGPPWGRAQTPRRVLACFNSDGEGIAVFSPSSDEGWNFGPHGAGKSNRPDGGPCVHVAPVGTVRLGPRSAFEYRYWLIVGKKSQLATRLDALLDKYADERAKLVDLPKEN